jgi:Cdc6-like AAA superfamily ATPase
MYGETEIDLSGVPGIGKTLTVNEVSESLKNESTWKNVKFISLNATKLPKPESIYCALFK